MMVAIEFSDLSIKKPTVIGLSLMIVHPRFPDPEESVVVSNEITSVSVEPDKSVAIVVIGVESANIELILYEVESLPVKVDDSVTEEPNLTDILEPSVPLVSAVVVSE